MPGGEVARDHALHNAVGSHHDVKNGVPLELLLNQPGCKLVEGVIDGLPLRIHHDEVCHGGGGSSAVADMRFKALAYAHAYAQCEVACRGPPLFSRGVRYSKESEEAQGQEARENTQRDDDRVGVLSSLRRGRENAVEKGSVLVLLCQTVIYDTTTSRAHHSAPHCGFVA